MEAETLDNLADVFFRTGHRDTARAHHATALRLASDADSPWHQARYHWHWQAPFRLIPGRDDSASSTDPPISG